MYTSEEQMPDKYSLFVEEEKPKKNISWYEGYKTTSTANNKFQIYTLGNQLLCT